MKYLIAIIAVVVVGNASAETCSGISNYKKSDGTVVKTDKCFVTIENNSGEALVAGEVVIRDTSSDDDFTVTTSATNGVFSKCMVTKAVASGAQGECQTKGYTDALRVSAFEGAISAGDSLVHSADAIGGKAATGAGAGDHIIGVALDAAAATAQIEAVLRF